MAKSVILAICGKSATGKDTLAYWLSNTLSKQNILCHNIISDTTRPRRSGEIDGKDYWFISFQDFIDNKEKDLYIETTDFRGWKYGTNKSELIKGNLFIGVFNPEGLVSLYKQYHLKYLIIPIYLEDDLITRLWRSYKREKKWRFEYIRRALADFDAFQEIDKILNIFPYYIKLEDKDGVTKKTKYILYMLQKWNILNMNCG